MIRESVVVSTVSLLLVARAGRHALAFYPGIDAATRRVERRRSSFGATTPLTSTGGGVIRT
jgi:hypothetical protein